MSEFELVRDFMSAPVTCKFDEDPIKNADAILRTSVFPLYVYGKLFKPSRTINYEVNSPIWSEYELIRDFIPVQVIGKFHKDQIKTKRAML